MPRLRAYPGPPLVTLTRRNLGSSLAWRWAIFALPSVEPSSTMITSRLVTVWAAMDRRQSASRSSLL